MNNIIVKEEINNIENCTCKINILCKNATLNIKGNVEIYEDIEYKCNNLTINILEGSTLSYYMYNDNNEEQKQITINNYNNSVNNFNYSFKATTDCSFNIENNIIGNDIKSEIKIRAIANNNAKIDITSNGKVLENTENNIFSEDIRGLNLDEGFVTIKPNLYVFSDSVIANHNTTIGNIDKNYLFYLQTKGIEKEEAKKLIINGFINSILNK